MPPASAAQTPLSPAIGYTECGDARGFPVVYCHGTPGSSVECTFAEMAAQRLGLRLIAPDRPGYGTSDPAEAMGHAAWAQALLTLLQEMGIARFALLGISGGAPNALALAAAAGERVVALSLVCPLGPLAVPELARASHPFVRGLLWWERGQPRLLDWLLLRPAAAIGRALPRLAVACMRLYNGRADRACLGRAAVVDLLVRSLRRAFQQGSAGVMRDLRLMNRPWDFALTGISVPVKLWHGTEDILLSPAHGAWIAARLAHAELRRVPGAGHFSLPLDHSESIMRELKTAAVP